ncbi:DUF2244 domain-containing protein [Pseudooceanicola sp. HF7]|uniref:DUF2244 domain-containing protein n=1 Tax=Pseudooceanicola sp. HF7 TaxID=2721560 RepID=UPI00143005EA|nr:DUF2244 domain-containing protein [Pseudooceanicola sp. HF7]NIZ09950.1 DUF2244 domain-containing protein [Pseudooceanicola sp. HF7]
MPYRWQDQTELTLTPHRSLPRRGFAVVILLFFMLVTLPVMTMIGTRVLWGLLPFAMAALAALWWGLQRSYRDGEVTEVLTLTPDLCRLTRDGPRGKHGDWQANPYWVEVRLYETEGPVPQYITLRGNGREVEIGAFLSEDERKRLYPELLRAFRATQAGGRN